MGLSADLLRDLPRYTKNSYPIASTDGYLLHVDDVLAALSAAPVGVRVAEMRERIAVICAEDDDFIGIGKSAYDKADRIMAALTPAPADEVHPDEMLPEAIRIIRQEASRDYSQEVVTGLKGIALLLERLIEKDTK